MITRISNEEISTLAKLAGLPSRADLSSFRRGLEVALSRYSEALEAQPHEIAKSLQNLWNVAMEVKEKNATGFPGLSGALCALPLGARDLLQTRAELQGDERYAFPSEEECRDPIRAKEKAERLCVILHPGGTKPDWYRELWDLKNAAERVAEPDNTPIAQAEKTQRFEERAALLATNRREALSRKVHSLSRPSRRYLKRWATTSKVTMPDWDDFGTAAKVQVSAASLLSILQFGLQNPYKRSPTLAIPMIKRGRPAKKPALELIASLATIYYRAKGIRPPRQVHPDNLGPFGRFVKAVLEIAGTPDTSTVELVFKYGEDLALPVGMDEYTP